jgi:hypothetical protein
MTVSSTQLGTEVFPKAYYELPDHRSTTNNNLLHTCAAILAPAS